MSKRSFLAAALSILVFLAAAVRDSPAAPRRSTFWACSDGAGTVLLFWLPVEGEWPEGGFRLERVSGDGKRKTVIAQNLLPGRDQEAMSSIDPWDAVDIRILAERIRYGTMTDEERNSFMTIMGRNAALDIAYGRALGVRHVDRTKESGNLFYRLTAIAADGSPADAMASNEVNPMRPTPGPQWPSGLRAEARHEGIALFWEDPEGGNTPPVVAYRVGRGVPGGRSPSLTKNPVEPNRGGETGDPAFLDADPPRETIVYQVQSIDLFARASAPAKVQVEGGAAPPALETPFPSFAAPRPPERTPPREISTYGNLSLTGADLPHPIPDAETERVPDEEDRTSVYRRKLKDSYIGLQVPGPSPRESRPEPREPTPLPGPASPARPSEEQERIDMYRRLAETGESGGTVAVPPFPESPGVPPAPPPSPLPVVEETPATPEERERIEMYRRLAEGMGTVAAPSLPSSPESPSKPPEPVPPVAAAGLQRNPEEEERIDMYRRLAEDRERGIGETAARETSSGAADFPPAPVIDALLITEGNVSIGFFPGDPSCPACGFLVLRSEERGNPAPIPVRSLPPEARYWTDSGVEPGKSYWYRVVAADPDGHRSSPSLARWIQVPGR